MEAGNWKWGILCDWSWVGSRDKKVGSWELWTEAVIWISGQVAAAVVVTALWSLMIWTLSICRFEPIRESPNSSAWGIEPFTLQTTLLAPTSDASSPPPFLRPTQLPHQQLGLSKSSTPCSQSPACLLKSCLPWLYTCPWSELKSLRPLCLFSSFFPSHSALPHTELLLLLCTLNNLNEALLGWRWISLSKGRPLPVSSPMLWTPRRKALCVLLSCVQLFAVP